MRKLLFCGGFAGLAVLMVFVLRVVPPEANQLSAQEGRDFSGQQTEVQSTFAEPSSVFSLRSSNQPAASSDPFADSLAGIVQEPSELQKLRNEYTQLAQSRAALMTVEELKDAVADAREETSELKAKKELAALVGNLGKLIEKYPQSKAAKEARKLLGKPGPNAKPETDDPKGEGSSEAASDSTE